MLPRDHYLKQAFQDTAHFPNGFEKGGLSDIQARLVRKNGTLINALCTDEVSDPTTDDLHILKVIANQSSPKSPVEQAWIKYLSIVKNLEASAPGKKSTKAKSAKAAPEAPTEVEAAPAEKPAKTKTEPAAEAKPAKEKTKSATKDKPESAAKKVDAKKAEPAKADTKKAAKEEPKKADSKKTKAKA